MKIADFRTQSSTPDSPGVGVISVYVDADTGFYSVDSNGLRSQLGTVYSGSVGLNQVATGQGTFTSTGVFFGTSTTPTTGLGTPNRWLIVRQGGTDYAIPAYSLR